MLENIYFLNNLGIEAKIMVTEFDSTVIGVEFEAIGVASVETADFGVTPTEGESQALITNDETGSVSDTELETFLNLDAGEIDNLGNGDATEGSAIKLAPVEVEAGQVLVFDWNFLTNEGTPSFFNDFAFVSIDSTSELADTNSPFVLSSNIFGQETGYQSFFFQSSADTTLSLGIGVVDVGDTVVDSGLLIDNLRVITPTEGTTGDDLLNGTAGEDFINGLAGDDTIRGLAGNDFLTGEEGNDRLQGGNDKDSLLGGIGEDTLLGGDDNDSLSGEDGNDLLQGESGNDSLNGGAGLDTIGGADGNDFILGGDDSDILSGGNGLDEIEGENGNDIIAGGFGADFLSGNNGNDSLRGDAGNDFLNGGNNNDNLNGGSGNDNLNGSGGSDTLQGSGGDDFLSGDAGNDRLQGGSGRDFLTGGSGNDRIEGGIGNDTLFGDSGADRFVLVANQGGENIADFEDDVDKFVLDARLSFGDLEILSTGSNTAIINDDSNVVLAVVENTPNFAISVEDFIFA